MLRLLRIFGVLCLASLQSACAPGRAGSGADAPASAGVQPKVTITLPAAPRRIDPLQFSFHQSERKCKNTSGQLGFNKNHFGECGDLEWADLSGKTMTKVSFRGANLKNANLGRGDFSQSDFRGADLTAANLYQGTKFAGALFDFSTKFSVPEAELVRLGFVKKTFAETQEEFTKFIYGHDEDAAYLDQMRMYLEWGVNLNDSKNPPLVLVVNPRRIETMKLFLWAGANPKAIEGAPVSPANSAVAHDCKECLPYLVAYGADLNESALSYGNFPLYYRTKVTPLVVAAADGKPDMIDALLQLGASINFELPYDQTFYRNYPTFTAISLARDLATVKFLLSRGADLKFRRFAVESYDDVGKFLLESGADINEVMPDGSGSTYFLRRMQSGASLKFSEDFSYYLKKGLDINARTSDGHSALSFAIKHNDVDSMRTFIAAGADVKGAFDANSKSLLSEFIALSIGSYNQNCFQTSHLESVFEMVSLFLTGGADPNKTNKNGDNAILALVRGMDGYACGAFNREHPFTQETFKKLLTAGARIDFLSEKDGVSALILASSRMDFAWMDLLLTSGADVNTKDTSGKTPIVALGLYKSRYHYFGDEQTQEALERLVSAGADLNTFYQGKSLLELYFIQEVPSVPVWSEKTLFWMMNAGANPNVVNADGQDLAMVYLTRRHCSLDPAREPQNSLFDKFLAAAKPSHQDLKGRYLVHYLMTTNQTAIHFGSGTTYSQGTSVEQFVCFAKPMLGRFNFNVKNAQQESVVPLVFKHLIDRAYQDTFRDMSEENFARWMKRMVSSGLDVNQTDTEGRSLYQLSVQGSWLKVAKALRDVGAVESKP